MPHLSRSAAATMCAGVLLVGTAPVALASTAMSSASVRGDEGGGSMPGTDHGSMPGMDHGSSGATSKDHGSGPASTDGHESTDSHESSTDGHESMPGMAHPGTASAGEAVSRPRAAVLGGFAAVNAVVMAAALVTRRRTADRRQGRARGAVAARA